MLEIDNIDVFYGKIQALAGISLTVGAQEIVSIIGANGAGKSTTMKTITGLLHPPSGSIVFDGVNITNMPTHKIVSMGIIHVPEGRHIFPKMTVYENLEMGAYAVKYTSGEFQQELEKVFTMFPRLKERLKQLGGSLSGGEQQMCAIARGLMARPKLLMLDEPSLGLAPIIVDEVFDVIKSVNQKLNIPILLVEQNAYSALIISHRAYVLEVGHVVKEGTGEELVNSPDIIKAYLGG